MHITVHLPHLSLISGLILLKIPLVMKRISFQLHSVPIGHYCELRRGSWHFQVNGLSWGFLHHRQCLILLWCNDLIYGDGMFGGEQYTVEYTVGEYFEISNSISSLLLLETLDFLSVLTNKALSRFHCHYSVWVLDLFNAGSRLLMITVIAD